MRLVLSGFSLSAAVCIAAAGCGSGKPRMDYSKAGLVDVSGTVQLDGEPLAAAIVIFEAPDATFSFARTDDTGRYRLLFDSVMPGVTKGPKTVRIRTLGSLGEEDPDTNRGGNEAVPPCYNSKSTLTVEVSGNSTATDFDLRGDCGS
jgi:hypothetical protein